MDSEGMAIPQEGDDAPDFALKDADGKAHELSDYRGKKVVLYFYPQDDTPGCTMQACDFRDHLDDFKEKNAVILGISPDDAASHKKFIEKYNIPYTLLSDADHKVSAEYGVWGPKVSFGKEGVGMTRSTFLIDEKGKIFKKFYKVNPEAHWGMLLSHL